MGGLRGLDYTIAVLGIGTAAIHAYLLINFPDVPFLMNALGYLTLVALFLARPAPVLARWTAFRWAFLAYTVVTILAWAVVGERTPLAYADKVIELLLVAALAVHLRRPGMSER